MATPMARIETRDPKNVDSGRIAVVAGSGALPMAVVGSLIARGVKPYVVLIEGEAAGRDIPGAECHVVPAEELSLILPRLKKAGVTRMILAGGVARRPKFLQVKWRPSHLSILPKMFRSFSRGDDGLLRALIDHVESYGIRIVGAHEVVPDLLAPEGVLTRARPNAADRRDIDAGSRAAIAIGQLDIGQAAVAIGGRAVALEGIEGTDGLLERTVGLRSHGRLASRKRGVLVKRCKPQQELRADLPAIGPATIDAAHRAGLAGVAVEAGRSFILDFDKAVARADELGLFIVGLPREGA